LQSIKEESKYNKGSGSSKDKLVFGLSNQAQEYEEDES